MADELRMCWVDLETTGLDANEDVPLEVGAILTDEYGKPLSTFHSLVYDSSSRFLRGLKRGQSNQYVNEMHTKNGLWEELFDVSSQVMNSARTDMELVHWLVDNDVEPGTVPMCGNSIGSLDRPFSIIHFPNFSKHLSYRNVDMSSVKEILKRVNPALSRDLDAFLGNKEDSKHRAIDDAQASITEYQTYIERFFVMG